ncbi:MAG: hypothetical protein HYV08_07880 [Deltaproteobacteria bacterium]|nr:hypothetical protein [Deltaproteobacteria bacterium]
MAKLLRGFLAAECRLLGVDPQAPAVAHPREAGPLTCPFAPDCAEVSVASDGSGVSSGARAPGTGPRS